jgi:hypothetical protein
MREKTGAVITRRLTEKHEVTQREAIEEMSTTTRRLTEKYIKIGRVQVLTKLVTLALMLFLLLQRFLQLMARMRFCEI